MKLEKGSPVPLYYQLADCIRFWIQSGELGESDKLPSEITLSQRAGVSRMTARQAITYLVREGLLDVKPGVGTFVAAPKLTYDALHLLGFTEEMMRQGGKVSSRVLEQRGAACPRHVADGLGLLPDEEAVRIVRLRRVDGVPLLLETSFVSAALCPGLEHEDLVERSLYELMAREYGLRLERARHTLEARAPSEHERELLGMDAGTSVIVLEGVAYAEHDRPAEYCQAVYRGDRFSFVVESQRGGRGGAASGSPQVSAVLIGQAGAKTGEGGA